MSKNIVVLSDGTGQEGGKGHDTNVYKLFRMLEDRTDRQVVFYDEGLGTDWRKFTGNAFGAGFSKNLLQCYQFIYENYNAGDKIFLFGFSRGAATVRSLVSFIHYFGILPKSRPELIKKAFKLYRRGRRGQNIEGWEDVLNEKSSKFVHEHPNQWAQIEFLGVWDTVPAIGLVAMAGLNTFLGKIFRYNFHDFKLHPSVRNAYHALSIDDDRLWFHPSLWTEKTREEQVVEQVWFSGAHTDIGGGFKEPGLSDVTLEWMIEKAVSFGLRLYLGSRKYWNFVVAPDSTDLYHPARKGFGKIFVEGKRDTVWKKQNADAAFGLPIIHKSVLDRHERGVHDHEVMGDKSPWILEATCKSSNYFEASEFKSILRQKFYEAIKFEWKKYDWEKEQYTYLDFDEWIKESKYKEYYGSFDWDFHKVYMEDGYKDHCIKSWKENKKSESRKGWMKSNPYSNDQDLDPNWLENYQPYKDWLEEHTEQHDKQIYYVEPVRMLKDFKFPDSRRMILRDYDEATCQEVFNFDGKKRKIDYERVSDRLEERGKWSDNRLDRDLSRWRGRK